MTEENIYTTVDYGNEELNFGGTIKHHSYRRHEVLTKNTDMIKYEDILHTDDVVDLDNTTIKIYIKSNEDNIEPVIIGNVDSAKTIVRSIRNAMYCWAEQNYKSAPYINVCQYIISVYDEKVNRYYTSVYEGNKYLLMNSIQKLNQVILNIEETFDAEVTHSNMIDFGSVDHDIE